MAGEYFLINPVRHRGRKKRTTRKKRSGGLPSALLRRMMKTYGPRRGMQEAWRAKRKGIRKNIWAGHGTAHRRASSYAKTSGAHFPRWKNPFGEEVMIVGANPRRRKRRHVRRRVLLNRARAVPRRRRVRRHRRKSYALMAYNPPRRRRHRRNYPVARRRYGRRYRRNPVASSLPIMSLSRPMSLLMPLAVGTGGYLAANYVPNKLGMTSTFPRLGVKAGVGFGGGMLISKFLGKQSGTIFMIGAGINLFQDILNTFIFKTTVSGLGAYPYYYNAPEVSGMEGGYEGVDAYAYEQASPY